MADAKPAPARRQAAANSTTTENAPIESTEPTTPASTDNPEAGSVTGEPSASGTIANTPDVDPTSGPQGAPSPFGENGRTGYHCGYCGEVIGAEGQHYFPGTSEVRQHEHPGTLVVADGGPQVKGDEDK